MQTSVAILSALVAFAAAHTSYTMVEVTITSCAPEVSNCPGINRLAAPQPETAYSTVGTTVTSCDPEVSACPGMPPTSATYHAGTESSPASGTEVPLPPSSDVAADYTSSDPALTLSSETHPSTLPISLSAPLTGYSSVPPAAGYPSASSGPDSSVAPYPITSAVTLATGSSAPIGTGNGFIPSNQNATSTYPPIASYTGGAGSVFCSMGAVAGLAAIAASFVA